MSTTPHHRTSGRTDPHADDHAATTLVGTTAATAPALAQHFLRTVIDTRRHASHATRMSSTSRRRPVPSSRDIPHRITLLCANRLPQLTRSRMDNAMPVDTLLALAPRQSRSNRTNRMVRVSRSSRAIYSLATDAADPL